MIVAAMFRWAREELAKWWEFIMVNHGGGVFFPLFETLWCEIPYLIRFHDGRVQVSSRRNRVWTLVRWSPFGICNTAFVKWVDARQHLTGLLLLIHHSVCKKINRSGRMSQTRSIYNVSFFQSMKMSNACCNALKRWHWPRKDEVHRNLASHLR